MTSAKDHKQFANDLIIYRIVTLTVTYVYIHKGAAACPARKGGKCWGKRKGKNGHPLL
jgi:hypothetical protein